MRAFVAINPTSEERERLWRASTKLRELELPVRWAPPENLHLTLKFLGEVREDRVPELSAAANQVVDGLGPFNIVARRFGAFPSLRRPQVVWTGIELNEALSTLQERLEEAMAGLGYARDKRTFHAHLTLGRTNRRASVRDFRGLAELVREMDYADRFEVCAIDVMRSHLTRSGALYDVVHSSPLSA